MLNLYFNVSATVQTVHAARSTRNKSAEAGVWLFALMKKKKKNVHVGRLNHSFNLTGRHKKSAPYYRQTKRTHTNAHTDGHTHAGTQSEDKDYFEKLLSHQMF